jgi:hypothetical protein
MGAVLLELSVALLPVGSLVSVCDGVLVGDAVVGTPVVGETVVFVGWTVTLGTVLLVGIVVVSVETGDAEPESPQDVVTRPKVNAISG